MLEFGDRLPGVEYRDHPDTRELVGPTRAKSLSKLDAERQKWALESKALTSSFFFPGPQASF